MPDAAPGRPSPAPSPLDAELLLRETNHRCGNDLQLVVSLLSLQSGRARSDEARQALDDVSDRVAVIARARSDMSRRRPPTLAAALGQVCDALAPHAELRSILLSLAADGAAGGLSAHQITTLALVVNELATNAIKHAFAAGVGGSITIAVRDNAAGDVVVTVDDDGIPFPDPAGRSDGLGLGLSRRLTASIGGLFIAPPPGGKVFELRVPAAKRG